MIDFRIGREKKDFCNRHRRRAFTSASQQTALQQPLVLQPIKRTKSWKLAFDLQL